MVLTGGGRSFLGDIGRGYCCCWYVGSEPRGGTDGREGCEAGGWRNGVTLGSVERGRGGGTGAEGRLPYVENMLRFRLSAGGRFAIVCRR